MKARYLSLPVAMHEDAFYDFFIPYCHPESCGNIWGGHGLETYGEDLSLVSRLDENSVWTVVDSCDNADQWIIPNVHFVNRVCYLVTEVQHNDLPIEFLIPHRGRSLTPLGLKRQTSKLGRILVWWNKASEDERKLACEMP